MLEKLVWISSLMLAGAKNGGVVASQTSSSPFLLGAVSHVRVSEVSYVECVMGGPLADPATVAQSACPVVCWFGCIAHASERIGVWP